MGMPAQVTTNLISDFKSANIGPYSKSTQVTQLASTATFPFGSNDQQELDHSFKATASGPLISMDLYLRTFNTPTDNVLVRLYDHDAVADHFGNLLATAQLLPASSISTTLGYRRVQFQRPATVVNGTTYWLRLSRDGAMDDADRYGWAASEANPYSDGRIRILSPSGWADAPIATDGRFKVNILQPERYAFALDKSANKVRCRKASDNQTWVEMDSANAPSISSSANFKTVHTQQQDAEILVFIITSSTRLDVFKFSTITDTWSTSFTNSTAPTFNTNVTTVAPMLGAYRSPDLMTGSVLSDYLFSHNGTTETVMGNARRRIKVSRRLVSDSTWNTPYDVVGSGTLGDATLPGTAIDYDLRALHVNSNAQLCIFWTQSDDSIIRMRMYKRNNTFGSILQIGSPGLTTSNSAAYPISQPVSFFKHPQWWSAFARYNSGVLSVVRCPSDDQEIASAWVSTDVVTATLETTNSNPAVLIPDNESGGKLYLFYTATDGKLYYTHDKGNDDWVQPQEIHPGTKTVAGLSANMLADAIGLLYLDTAPATDDVKFDAVDVFYVRADLQAGTFSAERDLRTNEFRSYLIAVDVEEMSGTSYLAQAFIRETETDSWQLSTGVGSESVETTAYMNLSNTFRYVRIEVTVSGGTTFESGVVGY